MAKQLIKAIEYKVQDGDTLDKIAADHGVDIKKLARFNWNTEDADAINLALRDRVGSRKKDTDNKTFLLSKEDDPGIIYIPKTPDAPVTLAADTEHNLTVRIPTKKTFKTSNCMVVIRPDAAWKGEYGFDWLRDGDWGKAAKYRSPLLDGGYKSGTPAGMTGDEARKALKKEFGKIPTFIAKKPDYHCAYVNIFPDGLGGTNPPPATFKVKFTITIEDHDADSVTVVLPTYKDNAGKDQPLFSVVSGSLDLPKAVGKNTADLELKCVHEYSTDQEIKIMTVTRETDGVYKEYISGKIIALANHAARRKNLKMVFVKVITDVRDSGTPFTGNFTPTEKTNMLNSLFQPLVCATFEDGADLDLSTTDEFKRKTAAKKTGKFYISKSTGQKGLYQDHKDFYATVKDIYLKKPGHDKYKNDFLVFSFGERPYDKALGQVQDIGVQNLIVFPNRDECTLNHEALHGLGLLHSFKDDVNKVEAKARYTFQQGKTDNVMDYTYDDSALITWYWQWKLVNP